MPGVTLGPDQARSLNDLFARVERLERVTRNAGPAQPLTPRIVFSYPGTLTAGTESPPFYPNVNLVLLEVRVSLLAAATSNHVVTVKINGTSIGTYTLPTSSKTITFPLGQNLDTGSYLTVSATTVTDSNLTVDFEQRQR